MVDRGEELGNVKPQHGGDEALLPPHFDLCSEEASGKTPFAYMQ